MQNIFKNKMVLVVGSVLLGMCLGWLIFGQKAEKHVHDAVEPQTYWTCAMHPQVKLPEALPCPLCGMELTEVTAGGAPSDDPYTLEMSASAVGLSQIQLTTVQPGQAKKQLLLEGKISVDERRQSQISADFSGRIDKLHIKHTGAYIQKGQLIATLHSPEFITAQTEFFDATSLRSMQPSVYIAARNKLRRWNVTEKRLDEIEETGSIQRVVELEASASGTVLRPYVKEGEYIKEGTPLFELADLRRVWVLFEAYESDLAWLKKGEIIRFTVPGIPGKEFSGKISFIDPVLNTQTRTVSVRIEVPNEGGALRPGMFANGWLQATPSHQQMPLLLPKSAVLWTGKRSIVYVKRPSQAGYNFQLREVTLGDEMDDSYIVLEGLQAGEEVVSNGAFKVDAAAQLAGNYSMMNPPLERGEMKSMVHRPQSMIQEEKHEHMPLANSQYPTTNRQHPIPNTQHLIPNSQQLLDTYFKLKNALVASEPEQVTHAAHAALKLLKDLKAPSLQSKQKKLWQEYHQQLSDHYHQLAKEKELDAQRKVFQALTASMTLVIQQFEVGETPVYQTYCPMAFDNQGAYWLSETNEVRNPYFGDAMLNCGWVEKVIE